MKRALALAALLFTAPAPLMAETGSLGTLLLGPYLCELPGDSTGPAGYRVPAEDFAVINASSSEVGGVRGTYLLVGDSVTMTSGPRRGNRYHRQSSGFLRKLGADGQPGALRCLRRSR